MYQVGAVPVKTQIWLDVMWTICGKAKDTLQ